MITEEYNPKCKVKMITYWQKTDDYIWTLDYQTKSI